MLSKDWRPSLQTFPFMTIVELSCVQEMQREYKRVTDQEKEEVVKLGGLHVIGTERHEARRVDNQLRGRSGRYMLHGAPPLHGFLG